MNIEKSFNDFYNICLSKNQHNFEEMENQRKKAINERYINKLIIITVECIVLIIIMFAIFTSDSEVNGKGELDWLWVIAFGGPILIAIKGNKELKNYEKMYQDKFVKSVIKDFSEKLEYYPTYIIPDEDFARIGTQKYNEFNSSNLIQGMYKNNEIIMAKVVTKYTYKTPDYLYYWNGKRRIHTTETFDGIFV